MRVLIDQFSGIAPKLSPRVLGDSLAQTALNVRLDNGQLSPLRGHTDTTDDVSVTTESLYKYQDAWLAFAEAVDFVPTPLANDINDRLFYTDKTYPKVRSGAAVYRLGIPRPPNVLIANAVTPGTEGDPDRETVSYVYTYVDAWGTEGPPSLPSVFIDHTRDTTLNITSLGGAAPTGSYNFGAGSFKRIYRSNTGSQGNAVYQFVMDVAIANDTATDNVDNALLQEAVPSSTWIGPPDDDTSVYPKGPLEGLTELPNGVMAGFVGNQVCVSEPYLPHAWPLAYRFSAAADVVGIVSIQQGLFVCTEGKPYLLAGGTPSSMARIPIDSEQACVSRQSIVDMGGSALYASPDGLCVASTSVTLVTADLIGKKEWAAYKPESIRAYQHEGRYIGFYDTGTKQGGFIYDPRGGLDAFVEIDTYAIAAYRSLLEDDLYFADVLGDVYTWETDNANPHKMTWKSKIFNLPKPQAMSVIRVQADAYPVTVRIYAGGQVVMERALTSSLSRLPSGFREREWEVQVEGKNSVTYIGLFTSMAEAV